MTDRGVMRSGMDVYQGGEKVGWVTSGTMVPYYRFEEDEITETTAKRSIGFALLDSSLNPGDSVEIDVRGKRLKAVLVATHLDQKNPPYARPILTK